MLDLLSVLLLALCSGQLPCAFATARAVYVEDDAGDRPIAEIGVALVGAPAGDHLIVTVAAVGAGVAAAQGWDGIAGANVVTARELARLVDEDRLRVAVDGRLFDRASVRVLVTAPVPIRRFDAAAGRFVETGTVRALPVVVGVAVGPLPPGVHDTELIVDGVPRLSIAHQRNGDRATIRAVRSLGGRVRR